MHNYSIDKDNRSTILFYLALLSIVFSIIITICLEGVLKYFQLNWSSWFNILILIFPIPFYEGLNYAFNEKCWKWKCFKKFVPQPNIDGEWEGYIKSSYDDRTKKFPIKVTIKQSWTEFSLTLRTETAKSNTIMAKFLTNKGADIELIYIYSDEVINNENSKDLHTHYGAGRLDVFNNKNELKGEYFTDKERGNQGEIYLKKSN